MRDHKLADTSVNTALGCTSMVGTMLAEELANTEDQVGTCQGNLASCTQ